MQEKITGGPDGLELPPSGGFPKPSQTELDEERGLRGTQDGSAVSRQEATLASIAAAGPGGIDGALRSHCIWRRVRRDALLYRKRWGRTPARAWGSLIRRSRSRRSHRGAFACRRSNRTRDGDDGDSSDEPEPDDDEAFEQEGARELEVPRRNHPRRKSDLLPASHYVERVFRDLLDDAERFRAFALRMARRRAPLRRVRARARAAS